MKLCDLEYVTWVRSEIIKMDDELGFVKLSKKEFGSGKRAVRHKGDSGIRAELQCVKSVRGERRGRKVFRGKSKSDNGQGECSNL